MEPGLVHLQDTAWMQAALALAGLALLLAISLWRRERGVRVRLRELEAAHAALRESRDRLALALDATTEAVWEWDLRTGTLEIGPRWHAMLGYAPGELGPGAAGWLAAVHPEDRAWAEAALDPRQEAEDVTLAKEYRCIARNGETRWFLSRGRIVARDARGRPVRVIGTDTDITARKAAEAERERAAAALRESEARFRNMADHAPVVIWVTDPEGRCAYLNRRWYELTGQEPGEGEGFGWLECLHPEDRPLAGRELLAASAARSLFRAEYRLRRADGGWGWMIDAAAPRFGEDGAFLGYIGSVIDITERKASETALHLAMERASLALAAGRMGTWAWDPVSDRLTWDEAQCRLFGLEPATAPPTGRAFLALVHPEDRALLEEATQRAPLSGEAFDGEFRILWPDGTTRWIAERGLATRDAAGRLVRLTGVNYDITARKAAEEQIRALAWRDPLTELPNRRMLQTLLAREMARAGREAERLALLLVDLDEFKAVNDTLGHSAGDALLVEMALRLQAGLREGDIVARLGGDEFAILAPAGADAGELGALAGRLVARLAEPVALRGVEVRVGASIGIALWPEDAQDAEALLAQADLALYAAKAAGRDTWRFFRPRMQARARELALLDRDLRRALERGEFVLHYQPIAGIAQLELMALEGLLRWRHPERGLLLPAAFLAAAERNRLIVPLTFWTLGEALRQAAAWRAQGAGAACVTVNLATPALEAEGLVEHIAARLEAEGLPGAALVVEVTEGALADSGRAVALLERLRGLGVRVAIDDFGAGCSSLTRLGDLPLDLVKIDRAFLATPNGKGEAILRAVVELARGLGLPAVAEGVETAEQLALLRRVGAAYAQGYLLARPLPADSIPAWVAAWNESRLNPQLDLLRRAAATPAERAAGAGT